MDTRDLIVRTCVTGALAGVMTALAAAAIGRRHGGALKPINATSHIAWGEQAGHQTKASMRYTAPGLLLNLGAAAFWAALYEGLFGRRPAAQALLGGPAISALAYVVDYHVVPKRLTPGWELAIPHRSLGALYAVLAAGLVLRPLLSKRRIPR